ncbi:flagellar basal body-associated FliL family protein [Sphingorhabdus sp. M41]|uniref:flagellar basal body-associated FliL family protein n=1 Tax=Sphingorhabdus sp. M41 TaxID=1806885 RepID=UPI0009EE0811|nr:flagellar basal body-associated FliL family protein [Sphingorhabdus sp. M41]
MANDVTATNTDQPGDAEIDEPTSAGTDEKAPRFSKKQKLIALGAAVLILAASGAGIFALLGSEETEHSENVAAGDHIPGVDVPDMVVNLRSPDGQARFLKLRLVIEPSDEAASEDITAALPNIIDAYQPFLRELRPEDISGSAAVFRLKEELLLRTVGIVGQDKVRGVLVQDLIQQ